MPVSWDETRVLRAEMGKSLVIARRKGSAWYLGGMTAGEPRSLELPLDFLEGGAFTAETWLDDTTVGPTSITRRRQRVSATDELHVVMPASGGFVARLAAQDADR